MINLFVKIKELDFELYEYLVSKFERYKNKLNLLFGENLPLNYKYQLEGYEKEIYLLKYLYNRDYFFLKSPADIIEDNKLFKKTLNIYFELNKLTENRYISWVVNEYKNSKRMANLLKLSWKRIFLENLKGYPDFILIFPMIGNINIKAIEVKRRKTYFF